MNSCGHRREGRAAGRGLPGLLLAEGRRVEEDDVVAPRRTTGRASGTGGGGVNPTSESVPAEPSNPARSTGTPSTNSDTRATEESWVRVLTNCAQRFSRVACPGWSRLEMRLTVATPESTDTASPRMRAPAGTAVVAAPRRCAGTSSSWARASRVASLSTGNHSTSGTTVRRLVDT